MVLAVLEWQSSHGDLPNDASMAPEFGTLANTLLQAREVNKDTISVVPQSLIEYVPGEFCPS